METIKEKLRREAKRIEEDSLYSAKRHFFAAAPWKNVHITLGVPSSVLAAIAGVAAFSKYENAAGVIAIVVAALTAISTFLDPNKRASEHMSAGNAYLVLRNSSRVFCEIESCLETSETELLDRLKALTDKRDELNQNSPSTPRWAYNRARKSIESGEADYAVDIESRREITPDPGMGGAV